MTFMIRDWMVCRCAKGGWVAVSDDEYHNVEWAETLDHLIIMLDQIDNPGMVA